MSEAWSSFRQDRTRDAWSCSRSRRGIVSAARSQNVSVSVGRVIAPAFHPLSAGGLVFLGRDHRFHRPVVLYQKLLETQVERLVGEPLGPHDAHAWHLQVLLHPGFQLALQ